jgi:micrococcal nuclease
MRPDCQNHEVKKGRAVVGVLLAIALVALLVVGDARGWWSISFTTSPAPTAKGTLAPDPGTASGGEEVTGSGDPAVPADAGEAWVDYVHDGDTLFLTDGRKVRLLGIDTPEVGEHAECYGDTARERLRAVLPEGTHVRTVSDVRPLDQYGRTLLFLFTDDGALVNLDLIRDGYAEAVVLKPNVLWAAEVEAAEDEAQAASRGMWGAC